MFIGIIRKLGQLGLDLSLELGDDYYLNADVVDVNSGDTVYSISTRDEHELFRCILNYINDPKGYYNEAESSAEKVEVEV